MSKGHSTGKYTKLTTGKALPNGLLRLLPAGHVFQIRNDKIDFVVNGTVVNTQPKSGPTAKTDGIYGIRVNHLLEVHVEGLTASK